MLKFQDANDDDSNKDIFERKVLFTSIVKHLEKFFEEKVSIKLAKMVGFLPY